MIHVLQSGVITATVNKEETPTRDLPCGGPPILKKEHTHTLFPPVIHSTPCHRPLHRPGLRGRETPRDGGQGGPASRGREA